MPRKITNEEDRAIRINICVKPKVLRALDKNVERFQGFLQSNGVDEKEARKVSRSQLIAEMVETLATEGGLLALQSGVALKYGIDNSQTELNLK